MTIVEAMEYAAEHGSLRIEDFDGCIIGVAERCSQQPLLVYDREKLISVLVSRDKMSREEAEEYIDYNVGGAWHGPGTPLIMTKVER